MFRLYQNIHYRKPFKDASYLSVLLTCIYVYVYAICLHAGGRCAKIKQNVPKLNRVYVGHERQKNKQCGSCILMAV